MSYRRNFVAVLVALLSVAIANGQGTERHKKRTPSRESAPRESELPPFPPALPFQVSTRSGTLSLVAGTLDRRSAGPVPDILALWQDPLDSALFVYSLPISTRAELGGMLGTLINDLGVDLAELDESSVLIRGTVLDGDLMGEWSPATRDGLRVLLGFEGDPRVPDVEHIQCAPSDCMWVAQGQPVMHRDRGRRRVNEQGVRPFDGDAVDRIILAACCGGGGGPSPCSGPCCNDACCGDPCCGDPCCGDPCCNDRCCQGSSCCENPDPCCDSNDPCCGNPDPCCNPDNPDCGDCGVACCHSPDPCCNNPDPCCGDPECCGNPCCQNPCSCVSCDDGDGCTSDTCSGGQCLHEPLNCDDGDECTTDSCEDAWCTHTSVCIEYQSCCGQHCCPRDQYCCGTGCCLDGQDCCNGVCCTGGTVCCAGDTCCCPTSGLFASDELLGDLGIVASACTDACSCLGTQAFCFCLQRCRSSECLTEWVSCSAQAGYALGLVEGACAVGCVPVWTQYGYEAYRTCALACGIATASIPVYEAGVCLDQLILCRNSTNQAFASCMTNAGP